VRYGWIGGRWDGWRGENLYILPASGWWSHSLPRLLLPAASGRWSHSLHTFKLMRRLRRRNHGRMGGFIDIKVMYNNDGGKGGARGCKAHEVK
jgi:hypothetical protein